MVIQHTNCGMFGFDDGNFRDKLHRETGQDPGWNVAGFTNLEASVRQAMKSLRDCPWLIQPSTTSEPVDGAFIHMG